MHSFQMSPPWCSLKASKRSNFNKTVLKFSLLWNFCTWSRFRDVSKDFCKLFQLCLIEVEHWSPEWFPFEVKRFENWKKSKSGQAVQYFKGILMPTSKQTQLDSKNRTCCNIYAWKVLLKFKVCLADTRWLKQFQGLAIFVNHCQIVFKLPWKYIC